MKYTTGYSGRYWCCLYKILIVTYIFLKSSILQFLAVAWYWSDKDNWFWNVNSKLLINNLWHWIKSVKKNYYTHTFISSYWTNTMNLRYFSPLISNTNVVSLISSSKKTIVFSFLYSSIRYCLGEHVPYSKSSMSFWN